MTARVWYVYHRLTLCACCAARALRDEIRTNKAANPSESGTPWPADWKPHQKLTAAILGEQADEQAANENVVEDTPLMLAQRLLYVATVQQRASAGWAAAASFADGRTK